MRPTDSFVRQPIRSLQTMLRVISEDNPSLPTVVPDGIYGEETQRAVLSFQEHNALPITGITDQATWEAIVKAYEPALIRIGKTQPIEIIMDPGQNHTKGEKHPNIFLLQAMLLYLSTKHSVIPTPGNDGILDDPTAEALAAFQLLAGLPPTGQLDKITWKYLVTQFTLNANKESR